MFVRLYAALNLGPKPPGTSNVPTPPPSSLPNSKLAAVMSSSAAAATAFMPADMLTYHTSQAGGHLSAFHSSPLSAPHVPPYMGVPHSSATPPKPPMISTSSIAKPMPISMGVPHPGSKGTLTKVVAGQLDKDGVFTSTAGGKPLKSSPQGGMVKFLGTSEGGVKGDGLVLSQSYYTTSASVLSSPSNSLSKILMAPSAPSPSSSQDPQQPMAASSPGMVVGEMDRPAILGFADGGSVTHKHVLNAV